VTIERARDRAGPCEHGDRQRRGQRQHRREREGRAARDRRHQR
jgi:hypothetical protein